MEEWDHEVGNPLVVVSSLLFTFLHEDSQVRMDVQYLSLELKQRIRLLMFQRQVSRQPLEALLLLDSHQKPVAHLFQTMKVVMYQARAMVAKSVEINEF